jgi:hypothetical protein
MENKKMQLRYCGQPRLIDLLESKSDAIATTIFNKFSLAMKNI